MAMYRLGLSGAGCVDPRLLHRLPHHRGVDGAREAERARRRGVAVVLSDQDKGRDRDRARVVMGVRKVGKHTLGQDGQHGQDYNDATLEHAHSAILIIDLTPVKETIRQGTGASVVLG
jgi:hypothetical protein